VGILFPHLFIFTPFSRFRNADLFTPRETDFLLFFPALIQNTFGVNKIWLGFLV
jgi:hypothetical protein